MYPEIEEIVCHDGEVKSSRAVESPKRAVVSAQPVPKFSELEVKTSRLQ
jgi:hypothetical protein